MSLPTAWRLCLLNATRGSQSVDTVPRLTLAQELKLAKMARGRRSRDFSPGQPTTAPPTSEP